MTTTKIKTFSKVSVVASAVFLLAVAGLVVSLKKSPALVAKPVFKQDFTLAASAISAGQIDAPLIGIKVWTANIKPVSIGTIEFKLSDARQSADSKSFAELLNKINKLSLYQYSYKDGMKESSIGMISQATLSSAGKVSFKNLKVSIKPGQIVKFWLKGSFADDIKSGKISVEFINTTVIKKQINIKGVDTIPTISVISPAANQSFSKGGSINVSWSLNSYPSTSTVDVYLAQVVQEPDIDLPIYSYQQAGEPILNISPGKLSQPFIIPADAPTGNYMILVGCAKDVGEQCKAGQSGVFKVQ